MVDRNLVGRCGLYCGACGIYRAYKDKGKYLHEVAVSLKTTPEKVRCEGCQALTPLCWGSACKIVQCQNTKGIKFCYECSELYTHACKTFEELYEENLNEGVDLRANLARIKAGDVDGWLKESEQRFRCYRCHRPLPANKLKENCYHCGAKL
jgi:hypothetical protein